MKRIVFLTNSSCGGAERVTVLFAKILRDAGFDVTILIYRSSEEQSCEINRFIPDDIRVKHIVCRYRRLIFKLASYFKHNCVDICFTSLPLLSYVNIILTTFFFRRIHCIVRECNTPRRHSTKIRLFSKLLYRFADLLISQTDDMKDEMAKVYRIDRERILTIINPIDKELIDKSLNESIVPPEGYKVYVAVGRVDEQKDYSTLLKAFAELIKHQPSSYLYIVGKDTSAYAMKQKELANELGISSHVSFEGFQSNPYKYMNVADCFVLSSIYEGLPNVLLDAIYLGVPVVATRSIPFITAILNSEEFGLSIPVKKVEELVSAMVKVGSFPRREQGISLSDASANELISAVNSL